MSKPIGELTDLRMATVTACGFSTPVQNEADGRLGYILRRPLLTPGMHGQPTVFCVDPKEAESHLSGIPSPPWAVMTRITEKSDCVLNSTVMLNLIFTDPRQTGSARRK